MGTTAQKFIGENKSSAIQYAKLREQLRQPSASGIMMRIVVYERSSWGIAMVFDVELTHRADDRYIARVLLWPDVVVEASSRAEALELIDAAIRQRRETGVEIVRLVVDDPAEASAPTSWRKHAGTFSEDELYQQMLEEIQRYRQEIDSETPT